MAAQASVGKARGERRESSSGIIELSSVCCSARSLKRDPVVNRLATEQSSRKRRARRRSCFIPTEIRYRISLLRFCRIGFLALIVCLWSCEWDPFGSDSKEIAHGYRLKRIGNSSQFALLAPYDTGGIIIDEIGWRKPFIIARAVGSQYWDRIDTDHAEHIRISDSKRMSDPNYRTIPVKHADMAWNYLKPDKRMW
jgi:hypothetical protein